MVTVSNNMLLVHEMLLSQSKYIQSRIKDKSYKEAFNNRMSAFIQESRACNSFVDFQMYHSAINCNTENKKVSLYEKLFKQAEREAVALALKTVGDIIESVDERFISGGSRLYEGLLDVKKKQK